MSEPVRIGFRRRDPGPLAAAIEQVVANGGWVNTEPDPDEVEPGARARPSVFSGRGRAVPFGTFVPGAGEEPHQVGVQHGAGRHAARQLRDAGVTFPAGTRLVQDHPRRGLIVEVPRGTEVREVAELLLQLGSQLTVVPLGERWVAEIY